MAGKKGWLIGGERGMSIHYGVTPLCGLEVSRCGVYATTVSHPQDVTCEECIALNTCGLCGKPQPHECDG